VAPAWHDHLAVRDDRDYQPDLGNYAFKDEHFDLKVFHIKSLQEIFIKSFSHITDNKQSAVPIARESTVDTSRTTELTTTTTVSMSNTATAMGVSITNSIGVSTTIRESVTTSIGNKATYTVPAFTSTDAQYGIRAYDIVYDLDTWEIEDNICWYKPDDHRPDGRSPHNVHVVAPTADEIWKFFTS
jgi:hypothetical protein